MLIGKSSEGKLVHIIKANLNTKYYCPACSGLLIQRRGNLTQAHFAHKSLKDCDSSGEGESQIHLLGKESLQVASESFISANHSVLEAYLPNIQQRADLLISYQNRILALEFQCSPINSQNFFKRNQGYHSLNIDVYWLLGPDFQKTWLSKIPCSTYKFINYQASWGYYLTYWDKNQILIYCQLSLEMGYLSGRKLTLSLKGFLDLVREANYQQVVKIYDYKKRISDKKRDLWRYQAPTWYRKFYQQLYQARKTIYDIPEIFFAYPQKSFLSRQIRLVIFTYFWLKDYQVINFEDFKEGLGELKHQGLINLIELNLDIEKREIYDLFKDFQQRQQLISDLRADKC